MGKKSRKSRNHENAKNQVDNKEKEKLQAVILADSFTREFRPLTLECPKVLLPICGVPMIEYTIEFLLRSGVEEIFVFCCWLAGDVEAFVKERYGHLPDVIKTITFRTTTNAGDALRELDSMNIIRSDPFIIISGDVISNMNLKPVLEQHEARRKVDKNCVMTMVFRPVVDSSDAIFLKNDESENINLTNSFPTLKTIEDDLVVMLNKETKQLLRYENDINDDLLSVTNMSTILKYQGSEFDIRYDLLDCHIDICSPEVLLQIADNYDYQDLRKDYIRREVQNFELGYRVFAHIATSQNDFAARIQCLRTYDAISHDIIRRWTYPLVLDNNWWSCLSIEESSSYYYSRGFIYKESENVRIDRSAEVNENTAIGANTSIDSESIINASIIGRHCTIGKNVKINNSYIWNNVTIEDNVDISHAIVCDNCIIKTGAILNRGCVLSFNVVIGKDVSLKAFSRITVVKPLEIEDDDWGSSGSDNDSDNDDNESNKKSLLSEDNEDINEYNIVGNDGKGRLYNPIDEDMDDGSDFDFENETEAIKIPPFAINTTVAIDAPYPILKSSFGVKELELARSKLWLYDIKIDQEALAASNERALKEISKQTDVKVTTASDVDKDLPVSKEITTKIDILMQNNKKNYTNIVDSFTHGIEDLIKLTKQDNEDMDLENLHLEVSCYKYAENRTFVDVVLTIVPVLFEPLLQLLSTIPKEENGITELKAKFEEILSEFKPLIERFIISESEEHALVEVLELFCLYGRDATKAFYKEDLLIENSQNEQSFEINKLNDSRLILFFPFILKIILVDYEMISLDGLNSWINIKNKINESNNEELINEKNPIYNSPQTKQMIEFITADDSSSSSSSSSSDSDGDSSDAESNASD